MKANRVLLSAVAVVLTSLSLTGQSKPARTIQKMPDFKLGQVWTTDQGITVTILAIGEDRKAGRVVHIRVDNIPWGSCGSVHLTRAIEHIAVTEKMLASSALVLSKESVPLPRSSIDAYQKWQAQKKREIGKAPLPRLIQSQDSTPMICNFLPNQT